MWTVVCTHLLVAAYIVKSGKEGMASDDAEPMLTMAPLRRATIPGSTAAVTTVTAHRFTRIILTHASTSTSCRYTEPGHATPALFTNTPTSSPSTASRLVSLVGGDEGEVEHHGLGLDTAVA